MDAATIKIGVRDQNYSGYRGQRSKTGQMLFNKHNLDQWFASETYVLSPIEKPSQSVLERSQRTGVGVLVLNGKRCPATKKRKQVVSSGFLWLMDVQ